MGERRVRRGDVRGPRAAASAASSDANSGGRFGVGEEDRAERDGARAGGDQLQRVEPGLHSAHADDRELDRGCAGVDGRERDRLQRRTGVAAGARGRASAAACARRARARGACSRARARPPRPPRRRGPPRRCPRRPARASRRAAGRSRRGRRRRSRPRSRAPRRRSGRRGSARSPRRPRARRTSRRTRAAEKPPTETQSGTPSSRRRGSVSREEALAARVREPDRVQHPGVGLGDPHRRVPLARLGRDRLRHEARRASARPRAPSARRGSRRR